MTGLTPTNSLFSFTVPFAYALAGGWQIFLGFVVILLISVIYGLYTTRGSGINQRPYANQYTSAPGAQGASVLSHDESAASRYTRGTR